MANRVGQRFGDYQLIRFLGEGTFGDVYFGEHVYQKTPAAVKVFKTKLTSDKLKDFINEVRTVLLRHPNIVQILDFGIGEGDIPFLVMDYAPNGTLLQHHPRGTYLPLATIVPYVKQIAAALQYAHDQRRIHRDVKPENMLFGANKEILLSDFGIAVVAHSTHSQRTEDAIGTALYMAPEQFQGKPQPASDQYALGIIVYEWLCSEPPFRGNVLELMYQHLSVPPPPLRAKIPTISVEVEQAVMRALAKDPHQRFTSVQAFAKALDQICQAAQPDPFRVSNVIQAQSQTSHSRVRNISLEQSPWSPAESSRSKQSSQPSMTTPAPHQFLPSSTMVSPTTESQPSKPSISRLAIRLTLTGVLAGYVTWLIFYLHLSFTFTQLIIWGTIAALIGFISMNLVRRSTLDGVVDIILGFLGSFLVVGIFHLHIVGEPTLYGVPLVSSTLSTAIVATIRAIKHRLATPRR